MDTMKIAKYLFSIIMIASLVVNIYFYFNNKEKSSYYEAIDEENLQLKDEVRQLEYEVENFSNTAREQYYEDLVSQANLFVDLAFVVKKEGYEKRKNEASNVMNEELQERFYPSDILYQDQVETDISNEKFYVEKLEKGQEEVDVIVELDHEMNYLNTKQKAYSKIFVRVTFENIDDEWIATQLEDIGTTTQNESKEDI